MKTTTRYSLIIFGFVIFVILAPLLILYVSGRKIDLNGRETNATGILDAKSNPGGATLQINNKDNSNTPAIARFLAQGQYKITLHKDGYYDWTKNLAIEPGKVTYAQSGVDEVQLIKKSEPKTLISSGVANFVMVNDYIWCIRGNSVSKSTLDNPSKPTVSLLNFTPTKLEQLRDKTHLLISDAKNNYQIINTDNGHLIVLPSQIGEINDIAVVSDDLILFRSKNSLISYNPTSKTSTTLRSDLVAFTMLGTTGYFASNTGAISSSVWNGSEFVDEQNIIDDSPQINSDQAQLIISNKKVLFFKNGNSDLFRVGKSLDLISSRVYSAELNLDTDELAIRTPSELWFYNFISNQAQLLTRDTTTTNDYMIHSAIGYGFVATANGVEAIEIDNRDKQNRYQIFSQQSSDAKPVTQLNMTINQKTVLLLQNGSVIAIDIRN